MNDYPCHSNKIAALRRIEGQIRGIQRMVQEKKYCIDILTQISAIKGALTRVEEDILAKHMTHCVENAIQGTSKKERQVKLDEIFQLITRLHKGYK